MPLPDPAPRNLQHTRLVECRGYRRDDGLWDIEGHLTDTKTFDIPGMDRPGGKLAAGEPLHEMWVRLTVDLDLVIHDVAVVTEWGPYHGCESIAPAFQVLKGLQIRPGFNQRTKELLGRTRGCTHLVELLGPVATTAFQTIYGAREKARPAGSDGKRPGLIDSCHMYAADGALVKKRWPGWYTGEQQTEPV